MDPFDPFHIGKMFLNYMNDGMDGELLRLHCESQTQEESASSSRPIRQRRNIERNCEEGHEWLFNDYFSEAPMYTNEQFRGRYQMHKHAFLHILEALVHHDGYFQLKVDAPGRSDNVDDYLRIDETTTLKCADKFTKGVINVFGSQYLRKANH
ncbi:uncharacterized protein LOC131598049 [Vicia villosa]|uniref:uncharacterized protein LOC131598049 n=1 Tax=Vicia villosa TaxID=3911 RepID=UPI00273BB6FD|nr:uncharacterized protein LOC131598049 [Vicia villosa]